MWQLDLSSLCHLNENFMRVAKILYAGQYQPHSKACQALTSGHRLRPVVLYKTGKLLDGPDFKRG
jgi:hypothetical protein